MATYMMFYVVPDDHLLFLQDHPALFDQYLAGEKPILKQSLLSRLARQYPPALPGKWPTQQLDCHSPEINHRQVNAFHYILNGTHDTVENVGCVFQTWFKPRHKSPAIVIDGENFALLGEHVTELHDMITGLTPELRNTRLADSGRSTDIPEGDAFVESAFAHIAKACSIATSKHHGLLWSNR